MLTVSRDVVSESLRVLREAGRMRKECVILWLAAGDNGSERIEEILVPGQVAAEDYFHIPPGSMAEILKRLRESELRIGAQVHTHPKEAFHSAADDRWAIVRHVGALSIVVPYFAHTTTPENFSNQSALFRLSPSNSWQQVPTTDTHLHYRINLC